MLHDHSRFKVVTAAQHLYEHSLSELAYTHAALPNTIQDAEEAMNYVFNVLYPRVKDPVALSTDLPTALDTPNLGDVAPELWDQRIVQDDGDGNAALYMFFKKDGTPAAVWNKIADLDFGMNSVVQGLLDQTQYLFARKFGSTDYDQDTGLALTGKDAGQHIYGGIAANENLTFHATNGDDPGVHTGFVQFDDDVRPYENLAYNLGTAAERWLGLYAGTAYIGTGTLVLTSDALTGSIIDSSGELTFGGNNLLTLGTIDGSTITASNSLVVDDGVDSLTIDNASILSTTGAISFGDENLDTTGTLASGVATIDTTLVLSTGSITDSSGTLSFGVTDLITTGDISAVNINLLHDALDLPEVNFFKAGNLVAGTRIGTDSSDNFEITALAADSISVNTPANWTFFTGLGIDVDGIVDTPEVRVGDLILDTDRIYNNVGTEILVGDSLIPETDNAVRLGKAGNAWIGLTLSSDTALISGPATNIDMGALHALNRNTFRDVAKTQPAQDGDALFYNALSGRWLASVPNDEISHSGLLNLTVGDDHTQYALLAGRVGGQELVGGLGGVGENLTLSSEAGSANKLVINNLSVRPSSDGTMFLGAPATRFSDLYMEGEFIGGRFQNTADPSTLFNATEIGRQAYSTADGFLYVNNGTEFRKVGNNSYNVSHTQAELLAPIDVSAEITDARNCIWQLCDVSSNEEIMNVPIQKTATTVTVENTVPLPLGNYRLIGIQV